MNSLSDAMRRPARWPVALWFVLGVAPAAAGTLALPAAEFDPPSTSRLLANVPLRAFVTGVGETDGRVLRIRHGGGEIPARRAERVRDALVALGLPSARLELMPAAAGTDEIILEIVSGDNSR